MAVLINGNGNEAIYAQQDADWFASIMGNQTAITAIGSKFAATLEDANTIRVADGVIITQEGRRIQLDVNELDLFDIPAGGQGQTNYYIIGYHLVTGDLSEQYCETFVRLMDNDTDTIPEDTFRSGADEVFVSLYRVTQVNLAITDMELLLPEITTVAQISQHLTELERSGAMPTLDFAHPVHVFASSIPSGEYQGQTYGLTFTASKDCYLYGVLDYVAGSGTANVLTIDGTPVATSRVYTLGGSTGGAGHVVSYFIHQTLIKAGSTVAVKTSSNNLHVFDSID